jgi:hypothetical protein
MKEFSLELVKKKLEEIEFMRKGISEKGIRIFLREPDGTEVECTENIKLTLKFAQTMLQTTIEAAQRC